jgi:ABC-type bacteriocin/lantibiotic exporter with double-glycine peptidase domain
MTSGKLIHSLKEFFNIINIIQLKNKFILLFFFTLFSVLLEILSLGMIIPYLNAIINTEDLKFFFSNTQYTEYFFYKFNLNEDLRLIVFLSLIFFAIIFVKFLYSILFEWYKAYTNHIIQINLSNSLFKKYISQNYEFFLKKNTSEFHRSILTDIDQFSGTASQIILLIIDIFLAFGILFVLFLTNPAVTVSLFIIFFIIGLLFFKFFSSRSLRLGNKLNLKSQEKIKAMMQAFTGIQEIIIHNKRKFFYRFFKDINFESSHSNMKYTVISSLPKSFVELIVVSSFITLIVFVFLFDQNVEKFIVQLGFISVALIRLAPACYRIIQSTQRLKFTTKPVQNIYYELINNDQTNFEIEDSKDLPFKNFIEFREVSFSYDRSEIIENLNFVIKKNEFVGIVGSSGSGKTTFINILSGILNLSSGEILLDGKKINTNTNVWRKKIGYVSQNVFILDETLKNNIAFGEYEKEINYEKLKNSIEISGLNSLVKQSPKSWNINLGENGSNISGGQIQRVGIARSLYRNPNILILDEATSSLDEDTEKNIMKNILDLKGRITIIFITHKLSLLKNCDKIFELKNKKLILKK